MKAGYRGRFAPSPTGPLHFGSLFTALAGYLEARSRGGQWHLRIEDLDTPRCVPGATDAILRTLERFGLHWDGEIVYQSRRREIYEAAIAKLRRDGWLYPCRCSRKDLEPTGPVYPGHCRHRSIDPTRPHALRIRVDSTPIVFHDRLQGRQVWRLTEQCGDFVVRRRDGIHAYQLAVVIDDAELGVTEVLRGSDLLDSTARQIHLQRRLGLATPAYCHIPVLVDRSGHKLSKQTGAPAVDGRDPGPTLFALLQRLRQNPPEELRQAPTATILDWAVGHWRLERLPPRTRTVIMAENPDPLEERPP